MWYIASFIRGMRVDDAINQLSFVNKKGAGIVKEILLEAKELAVKEHHIEFPSNLWVSESNVSKGVVIKGVRRHARRRFGEVRYMHCHYFVTLEEGDPPEHYYHYTHKLSAEELLNNWLENLRKRTVPFSI